jgi:hypothetical protein
MEYYAVGRKKAVIFVAQIFLVDFDDVGFVKERIERLMRQCFRE